MPSIREFNEQVLVGKQENIFKIITHRFNFSKWKKEKGEETNNKESVQ